MPKVKGNPDYALGGVFSPFNTAADRDSAYPTPKIGQIVWMVNPCVNLGRSRLMWYPTGAWYPPIGELIVELWQTSSSTPVVGPTTAGVTTLLTFYASPIVPDYMLQPNSIIEAFGFMRISNPAGSSGAMVGMTISGAVPTATLAYLYAYGLDITPTSLGAGVPLSYPPGNASGGSFRVNSTATEFRTMNGGNGSLERNSCGVYVSNNNRAYIMVRASKTDDSITFGGHRYCFMGF